MVKNRIIAFIRFFSFALYGVLSDHNSTVISLKDLLLNFSNVSVCYILFFYYLENFKLKLSYLLPILASLYIRSKGAFIFCQVTMLDADYNRYVPGNPTYTGTVKRNFAYPVLTSKVRVYPYAWTGGIAMAARLYGYPARESLYFLCTLERLQERCQNIR